MEEKNGLVECKVVVDKISKVKVLIFDVDLDKALMKLFGNFGFVVCDAEEITRNILEWKGWNDLDRSKTVLVFPGNGANLLKKYLSEDWLSNWQTAGVFAKRFWEPGQDPYVIVERIFPDYMALGIDKIVLLDDVVSSGMTFRKVREKNIPWIPNAQWLGATWIAQEAAKTTGFETVFSAKIFGSKNAKVPIISLSTLISEKEIAVSFAKRNFSEELGLEFLAFLDKLR